MPEIIQKSGYVKPKIEEGHFVFGGGFVPNKVVLRADGQWQELMADFEPQKKGSLETFNCTSFNTLKPLQSICKLLYSAMNFCDRHLGLVAGTTFPGNDPHKVADAAHNNGLVLEEFLPFSDDLRDIKEYYSYKGGNVVECAKAAKAFLDEYDIFHEWVFTTEMPIEEKQRRLMGALKYSPLGVSVHAWKANDQGIYTKDTFDEDNHWTTLCGYVEGDHWVICDSYEPGFKKLAWNYDFGCAKVYFVLQKAKGVKKKSWPVEMISNLWTAVLDIIKKCYNK